MRIIETAIYDYSELSEAAKEKARQWAYDGLAMDNWWDCTYEDAAQAGLELQGFDTDSASFVCHVQGEFTTSAPECAEYITANHGENCDTYKAAKFYQAKLEAIGESPDGDDAPRESWEQRREEADAAFLTDLLHCYKRMLQEQLEYMGSEEQLADFIEANEYTFTAGGEVTHGQSGRLAGALRAALASLEWCEATYGADWPAGASMRETIKETREALNLAA